MAKRGNTKKALLMSALSLLLCVSMLVGTTFAWFTDEVTSGKNTIIAGNLDIELYYATPDDVKGNDVDWKKVNAETPVFDPEALWEPGYAEVVYFKVVNEGSLALKYLMNVDILSEIPGKNKDGKEFKLSEYIQAYAMQNLFFAPFDSREDVTNPSGLPDYLNGVFSQTLAKAADGYGYNTIVNGEEVYPYSLDCAQWLEPGEIWYTTLVLFMPKTVGNEANHDGNHVPKIDLGINVFATQYTYEEDSFGPDYDENAPKTYTVNGVAYDTAELALAAAKEGDKVYLSSVTEPIVVDKAVELTIANTNIVAGEGVNAITVNADATIIVNGYNAVTGGKNADGIYVADGVALTLTGTGSLITKGNGGSETMAEYNSGLGGSGIDVNGTIVITDLANLIAEGYGKHAFGIGGNTSSIVIENSTVNYAKGGMVKSAIEDMNYGKKEPEAGAAIGSSKDGAVIDINKSTIVRADGGSKAAGIGAMYHTGVTVNITNSNVTAFGGTSSAGIGGSRVTKHESAEAQAINVNIVNSTVNATGGDFAAGIGSGYNTYCAQALPVTTVNIDAKSNITAQGGLLGAGVGTGHNCIEFVGNIACDTTNIKAGSSEDPSWCCWGNPCTEAQDVGIGVISINNFKNEYVFASTAEEMVAALEKGEDVILTESVKIDPANLSNAYGTTGINVKNGQTIDGLGNTLDIRGAGGTWDSGINTTGGIIRNLTVTGSFRGIFVNHNSEHSEPVVLQNVTIDGTVYTISCDQGMNQKLIATNSTFNGWTSYAATLGSATFENCNFGEGNGYAYMRPYAPTAFVNCDFAEGYEIDARAAITFENCTINGVALTAENLATLVTSNVANATVK